jgi:protein-S-isoprenylcysteine O-methyltransferase Ste14
MSFSWWSVLSAGLLLACLISFRWAMRNFFSCPVGDTSGIRLIRTCSIAFAVLHLVAIIVTPNAARGQVAAAATLYVSALALFWWAIRTNVALPLTAAFSTDVPHHLVQHGPYRIIRHPFYCSYLLMWAAGVIATGRLWLLPSLAAMLAIYWRAASVEEAKFASSPLAGAYRQYRSCTGMFGPNPVKMLRGRFLAEEDDAPGVAQYRA